MTGLLHRSFAAGKCEGVACPAGPYPCKLLAIIPQQHNEFLEETELIVLPALKPSRGGDSVLFKEWIMAKNYVNINVSSVLSSPFVLEIGKCKVSVAVPYAEWPLQYAPVRKAARDSQADVMSMTIS